MPLYNRCMVSVLLFFSAYIGADDLSARREPLTQEQYSKLVFEDIVEMMLQESNSPEMIKLGHALQNHPGSLIKQPDEERQWIKVAKIAACASLALLICYLCIANYDMQQKIVKLEENDELVRILAAKGINERNDMKRAMDIMRINLDLLNVAVRPFYESRLPI